MPVSSMPNKRLLISLLTLILLTLPLTLYLTQQQQDLRQEAAIRAVQQELPPVTEREVGKLIVKHKKDVETNSVIQDEVASKVNLRVEKKLEELETEIISVQPGKEAETIVELRDDPNIEYIEPDVIYGIDYIPNDPEWSKQYALPKVSAPQAWDKTRGDGIKVAVVDSGIDLDHPDLAAKIILSKNFSSAPSATDIQGHGTHVAGIVAAITGNDIGTVGGCPGCQLINAKVLADDAKGTCSDIADGIMWAADNGAKVISMSFGSSSACQTYENAINYAWNKGAVLIATAGNNGDQTIRYPAYYPNVVAVAATNSNDEKHSTSSYGTWVDVAAPGDSIYSTLPDGYGYKSGTSMAAPLVSAVAALIWSTPLGTSNTTVRDQLQNTADRITGTGTMWKYGRINAERAVTYIAVPSATPTPTRLPTPTPTRVPTPTPTRVPTSTRAPTPISSAQSTKLTLALSLHGIARSGDNVNPGSQGNLSPRTAQRSAVIEIFNSSESKILQKSLTLTFQSATGVFTGTADLGANFPSGSYIIKVKTPMYLRRTVPGIISVTSGSTVTLPQVTLIAGDANNDNILNILDYTLIVGCYSDLQPAKDCDITRKSMTDFTDDGNVNQLDYNLFLREMSRQAGD